MSPAVRILAFGDSGYHLSYLELDESETLHSLEEFIEDDRRDWLEDGRPLEEFTPLPVVEHPQAGFVPASGLHAVADAMKRFCSRAHCDFAVMLGDNIYPAGATRGADGLDDADRFEDVLADPFRGLGHGVEDFTIYATLGNHDWETSREGALDQLAWLEASPLFYVDGRFYRVVPPNADGLVELFVVDTEVLLAGATVYEDKLAADGSEIRHTGLDPAAAWARQPDGNEATVQWLEEALRTSDARWKIVMGHHPLWSSGGTKFEQSHVLRELLLPTLCRYADMYLAGHEHTLEVHTDSCATVEGPTPAAPLVEIVSGAAAKQRPVHSLFQAYQDRTYPEHESLFAKGMLWGFAYLTLAGDSARAKLLSIPDDGREEIQVEFTYQFERRSASSPP